ncbi:baculoviral IAP repeat-containing protein 5-like [Halichondria panicea]|uniref:Baculoviral IAP repeat-containing protein 5-like protein n=1 Tax=Halichondria panicea TaxID=6063 RepID=A0A6C0SMT7_HALPA|nr:baculoviral IAP repeat-containing protein 5-like protein [Halichondria panicea]
MSTGDGRSIETSSLYLVEDRVTTFEGSRWPFESGTCTAVKMAEAGFYYCGSVSNPDWVRCVVCHQDMEGWEESDNPTKEHKRSTPGCAYLKLKDPYKITFADVLELERCSIENYSSLEEEKLVNDLESLVDQMRDQLTAAVKNIQTTY